MKKETFTVRVMSRLDIETAVFLARQYNMEVAFETARMYTGEKPDIPLEKVFGVTSFEIG